MAELLQIEDKAKYLATADEYRAKLRKLRFDHALSRLDKTSDIRAQRKELARVLTKISQIEKMEKSGESNGSK